MPARSTFAAAIAHAEGYGPPAARPTRNNNPGDLKNWPGVSTDAGGYSVFPSAQAGWNALEQQLATIAAGQSSYYSPEMTLAQMGEIWAGGDSSWASNVASYLGVSTAAMIGTFLGQGVQGVQGVPGSTDSFVVGTSAPLPAAPAAVAPPASPDMAALAMILGGVLAVYLVARDLLP